MTTNKKISSLQLREKGRKYLFEKRKERGTVNNFCLQYRKWTQPILTWCGQRTEWRREKMQIKYISVQDAARSTLMRGLLLRVS